jgi:hypothetical protein
MLKTQCDFCRKTEKEFDDIAFFTVTRNGDDSFVICADCVDFFHEADQIFGQGGTHYFRQHELHNKQLLKEVTP